MKKLGRALGILFGSFLVALGVVFLFSGLKVLAVVFAIGGGAIIAGFIVSKRREVEIQKALEEAKFHIERPDLLGACQFRHVYGLSVNQFQPVDAVLYREGITFEAGGRKFELPKERITIITCKQDVQREISKIKGTGGNAMLGGLLLGPTGAIIGSSSARNVKYNTTVTDYFVVNYRSQEGELQAITLQLYVDDGWRFADLCNAVLIGNNTVL